MKDDIRMNLVTPREDESVFLKRAVNKRHFVTRVTMWKRDDDEGIKAECNLGSRV
jgi:hypothetical protein